MITITDYDDDHLWCGVFQGGGARGAAYAGALEAVHARGHWFTAAAGSSAGAITAALVAAGLSPEQIRRETPRLLATVRPDTVIDKVAHALGWQHLVRFDSTALEHALDQLLRRALGLDLEAGPVTFAQLVDATGIRLYVIVGDASTGVPVPFSAETTPQLPVATAVIASCAIPVLFAPRYALIDSSDTAAQHGPLLRRLHDGGLWANFPAFTFTDEAFRAYHRLDPTSHHKVLGFSLLYDLTPPARIDRFVDISAGRRGVADALSAPPDPTGPSDNQPRLARTVRRFLLPLTCLLAAVVLVLTGTDRAELLLPAATFALIAAVAAGASSWRLANLIAINIPIAAGGLFGCYAWYLIVVEASTGTLPAGVLTAALAVTLITVGLMMHRIMDRTATGLHGAVSLLTGPTIRHAPWVDHLPGSHLIYLPTGGLTMLSFDAPAATVTEAVDSARISCAAQLDHILTTHGAPAPLVGGPTATNTSPRSTADPASDAAEGLQHIVRDHVIVGRRRRSPRRLLRHRR